MLLPNDKACQNCTAGGSLCLFAPRVKTGRPRHCDKDSPRVTKHSSSNARESASVPQPDAQHSTIIQGPLGFTTPNTLSYDTSSALEDYFNCHETTVMRELEDHDGLSPSELHNYMISSSECGSSSPGLATPDSICYSWTPSTKPKLAFNSLPPRTPTARSSSPATPAKFDMPVTPDTTLDFKVFLQLCRDLDHCCYYIREPDYNVDKIYTVLTSMESGCAMAIKATPSSSTSYGASTALVLAALYKVFEMCEAFLRRMSGPEMAHDGHNLQVLLLLKRLDVVLLQAKIFLTRIGRWDAAEKAKQIHNWVDSLIKHHNQNWN